MEDMNQTAYLALIDDTLPHIRALQPKPLKDEEKVELSPLPQPKKVEPKPIPRPLQKSAPLPPAPKKVDKNGAFLALEIPPAPREDAHLGIQKVLKEIDPDLYLHQTPPSDHRAKRIKEAWREKRDTPDIPILFQGQHYRSFINNIAKAIDTLYGSCRVVEIEPQKKWDLFLESENLKLIIAPDSLIFATKELLPFYQENPKEKSRKLGNVPLLLLPDISLYFKDPYLKRALWNVIKTSLLTSS
jgi:hypothetical protein